MIENRESEALAKSKRSFFRKQQHSSAMVKIANGLVIKNYQQRKFLFCNEKETMAYLLFYKQDNMDDWKNLIE